MTHEYVCFENQCVARHNHIRHKINEYRTGVVSSDLHVPGFFHVNHDLIEEFIDAALERRGEGLRLVTIHAGLSDRIGIKIAHLVEVSDHLEILDVQHSNFSFKTISAIAEALHVNTSVRVLRLGCSNTCARTSLLDFLFAQALAINPNRPHDSQWVLTDISSPSNDYPDLVAKSRKLERPSMVATLLPCLYIDDIHRRRKTPGV